MSDCKVCPYINVRKDTFEDSDGYEYGWVLFDESGLSLCESSYNFDTEEEAKEDSKRLRTIFVKSDLTYS